MLNDLVRKLDKTGSTDRASAGCLTLLEILRIYWQFTKCPENFLVQFASLRVCR